MQSRNLKMDLFRGFLLLQMTISHVWFYTGNNIFFLFDHFGNLWVSAAEGFVFISGYFVGLIYFPKMLAKGSKAVFVRLWKKAFGLYALGVFLAILFSIWGMSMGLFHTANGNKYADLYYIVKNAIKFKYFYGWADIISLYATFLFAAPIVLLLLKKRLGWVVALISAFLWSLYREKLSCYTFCVDIFSITAWQAIFVAGIFVGVYREFFRKLYHRIVSFKQLNFLLILVFVISYVLAFKFWPFITPFNTFILNKPMLGAGRFFLFFVWFFMGYQIISIFYKTIYKFFGWLLLTFGQNSLLTYTLHSFIVFSLNYIGHKLGYFESSAITVLLTLLLWVAVRSIALAKKNRF